MPVDRVDAAFARSPFVRAISADERNHSGSKLYRLAKGRIVQVRERRKQALRAVHNLEATLARVWPGSPPIACNVMRPSSQSQ